MKNAGIDQRINISRRMGGHAANGLLFLNTGGISLLF